MRDGILSVIDLNNRYRLDSIFYLDQCTLQYCFRLFDSVLKIFSCTVICQADLHGLYTIICRAHSIMFGIMYTLKDR